MKRFLFSLAFAVAVVATFNSCTKEYITNEYVNPSRTFIYTIQPNTWTLRGNGLIHTINLPELTRYYLEQGFVSAAISADGENSYDILPSTFIFETVSGNQPIAFSVNYTVGALTIYAEDAIDDAEIDFPAQTIILKVSLTDADYVD